MSTAAQAILSRADSSAIFKYRSDEGTTAGVLKDRAAIASDSSASGVHCWDVVDLIANPDDPELLWMLACAHSHDQSIDPSFSSGGVCL